MKLWISGFATCASDRCGTQNAACRRTDTVARGAGKQLGRRGDDVHHRAHADTECALVDVERGLVQIQLWALSTPHAESSHRTGHIFEVPGEVLTTAGLMGVGQH